MANVLDFDECQMYFGYPYQVNKFIKIQLPTIGQIIEFGEQKYFGLVHTLTCIPSDMKSFLFDAGIDYEEISDFDFFCMRFQGLKQEDTKILFGEDFDPQKFKLYMDNNTNKMVLYNPEEDEILDELAYIKIVGYIRKAHNLKAKVEKAANKTTKKILIDLDREDAAKTAKKKYQSQMLGLVSAMMRYPGFKYKSTELKECGIYEFMDTVQGAQIYVASTALLQGSYSGFCDTSKINKKQFNWMRGVNDED